jgi:glyoxylase-like metal-dependent hydrolase (beta-lactamase superfamily II)
MVYDARTRLLLSGDMLYAGRLYVRTDDFTTFRNSSDRLAHFARSHPISMLLGAHIEMTTTSAKDYAMEAPAHPDEHSLELPVSAIDRLQRAVHAMSGAPVLSNQGDFIVYPRPPQPRP